VTGIQWTHVPGYRGETWNPTTGCTRVSAGCDNCYAERLHNQRFAHNVRAAHRAGYLGRGIHYRLGLLAARLDGVPELLAPQYDEPFLVIQLLDDRRLMVPIRHRAPRCYFVDSMTDLFHEAIPDDFLDRVFAVIASSPAHLFLILTKRPERMRAYMSDPGRWSRWLAAGQAMGLWPSGAALIYDDGPPSFLANTWLGVSAEDQPSADARVLFLLDTPAARRFVSYEPALGPVDFTRIDARGFLGDATAHEPIDALEGGGLIPPSRLDWIIVGGESGPGARPFEQWWAADVIAQGAAADVPVFVKQFGSRPVGLTLRQRQGGDPAEWPEWARVRQFPEPVPVG
jgi:protein gp37